MEEEEYFSQWLELAAGTVYVPFANLPHLLARAKFPVSPEDEEFDFHYGFARLNFEEGLKRDVSEKELKVRDALTGRLHSFPIGQALLDSVVKVSDLRAYAADFGIGIRFASPETTRAAQPTVPEPDSTRRLRKLRELGGRVQWFEGDWKIIGINELEARERAEGRPRVSQKTIRTDLKEAAQAEKREGPVPPSASPFPT